MANQIGKTRVYGTSAESTSPSLKLCPICKVSAVPRGISSTRPVRSTVASAYEKHCPNCGHSYNKVKGS